MKVFVASDHAGFRYKEYLIKELKTLVPLEIVDLGTNSEASVDYPDLAKTLCHKLLQSPDPESCRGILICGSGQGMAMTANKFGGIRAALCWDIPSAILSRQHNNANVLCMGARLIPEGLGLAMTVEWLKAEFQGGRHAKRVEKINQE